ncbi:MAG: hypothetical protein AB8B80_05265, partial [Marinicellaceae bacterium]
NTGSQGGGIAIFTGTTNITAHNLMLRNNTASTGGGIFCDGSGLATILIDGDETNNNGITGNLANNGNGGGVYLSNGCQFTSYVGTRVNTNDDKRGIFANFSTRNGGGLYIASESKAYLFGNSQCVQKQSGQVCRGYNNQPINVSFNISDIDQNDNGSGAGIYVSGNNSIVEIYNGLVENNNTARGDGGAAYVGFGAQFTSDSRFTNGTCWSPGSCNQFINNEASAGGVIQAESGSELAINRSFFSGNLANVGNIVNADGINTSLQMQGNLIFKNGDFSGDFSNRSLFNISNQAFLNLSFSTIADNNINNNTAVIANDSGLVLFESSIVSEVQSLLVYEETKPFGGSFYCLMVHESNSLGGTGQFITTQSNPGFMDRENENYRLDLNSSNAIDYCDMQSAFLPDADNELRGLDWEQIDDFQGPYDLGYDEQTDIIFKNSFD